MSYPTNSFSGAYSSNAGISPIPPGTYYMQTNPSSSTLNGPLGPYKLGNLILNEVSGTLFYLSNLSTSAGVTTATWTEISASTGALSTLTTQDSTVVVPTAGNINLSGHSGQLTTTGSGSTATVALASAVTAPGSLTTTTTLSSGTTLTAGTGLTVTTGGATITAGGLTVTAGGAGITGTTTINTSGAGVTSIGTGGTGATNIGNATGNTAVTGSLSTTTTLKAGTSIISAPTVSSTVTTAFGASLTVGTPVQNTTGYDILVNVAVTVSSSTTATLTLGVGTSATPTTNTAVPSFTVAAATVFTLVAYVPNNYYLSVGSTGTISVASATVVAMGI